MGGGHVSRPDFGMPQPDPAHPLTEFYCLLQRALDREGVFALPALYAQFRAPARRIYADEYGLPCDTRFGCNFQYHPLRRMTCSKRTLWCKTPILTQFYVSVGWSY